MIRPWRLGWAVEGHHALTAERFKLWTQVLWETSLCMLFLALHVTSDVRCTLTNVCIGSSTAAAPVAAHDKKRTPASLLLQVEEAELVAAANKKKAAAKAAAAAGSIAAAAAAAAAAEDGGGGGGISGTGGYRSTASALAVWRQRRGVQLDITGLPGGALQLCLARACPWPCAPPPPRPCLCLVDPLCPPPQGHATSQPPHILTSPAPHLPTLLTTAQPVNLQARTS